MSDVTFREYFEKVLELRFGAADEALRLATRELSRRLEGMNEVREQLAAQKSSFVSREYYEGMHSKLQGQVDDVKATQNKMIGYMLGVAATAGAFGSIITILIQHVFLNRG